MRSPPGLMLVIGPSAPMTGSHGSGPQAGASAGALHAVGSGPSTWTGPPTSPRYRRAPVCAVVRRPGTGENAIHKNAVAAPAHPTHNAVCSPRAVPRMPPSTPPTGSGPHTRNRTLAFIRPNGCWGQSVWRRLTWLTLQTTVPTLATNELTTRKGSGCTWGARGKRRSPQLPMAADQRMAGPIPISTPRRPATSDPATAPTLPMANAVPKTAGRRSSDRYGYSTRIAAVMPPKRFAVDVQAVIERRWRSWKTMGVLRRPPTTGDEAVRRARPPVRAVDGPRHAVPGVRAPRLRS